MKFATAAIVLVGIDNGLMHGAFADGSSAGVAVSTTDHLSFLDLVDSSTAEEGNRNRCRNPRRSSDCRVCDQKDRCLARLDRCRNPRSRTDCSRCGTRRLRERCRDSVDSGAGILPVNNDDWLHQCAQTFQTYSDLPNNTWSIDRSNHYLIAEPSGLCADALSCVFDQCRSVENFDCLLVGIDPETGKVDVNTDPEKYVDLQRQTFDGAMEACGYEAPVALPDNISFPKTAADVVAAVEYAKENGMQVTVKSTGHCYTGCHTKAGTLMINMRDFAKHSAGDDSVVECDEDSAGGEDGDACVLALARGKTAYIRVGGGQTWSDVYNAVFDAGEAGSTSKLYGVVGGGAGSVGAAGGWLQGGGLSVGYERMHGMGVDQILEFELVLPNAAHVKIFPSEWDIVDGYVYPQTKKVAAWCNANVSGDEAEWDWQPCTDEELAVSPENLWRALRGGGGGTYGVVTSVKYQLFEEKGVQIISMGTIPEMAEEQGAIKAKIDADGSGELYSVVSRMYTMFLVDLLFAPEKIGISDEFSLHTGYPEFDFRITSTGYLLYWGEGDFLDEVLPAWNETVDSADLGGDDELADAIKTSTFVAFPMQFKSYSEFTKLTVKMAMPNLDFPPDAVPDLPLPQYYPSKGFDEFCSFNLPLALLQSSDEADRDLVFKVLGSGTGGHVTGGNLAKTGDGMDSVSPSERVSGQSSLSIGPALATYDNILGDLLNAVYKNAGDGSSFPGYYEYNHICPGARVASRSDWTKECDPEEEDDCFSIQEATWGTEVYKELQAIKAAVDPNNMLECYPCVKHPSPTKAATAEAVTSWW